MTELPAELSSRPYLGENSQYITRGLFINARNSWQGRNDAARFSLGPDPVTQDGVTYPTFQSLFVATDDETGVLFAEKYLSGVPHFVELCNAPWFQPHLESARKEISLRRHSRNIRRLQEKADSGDTTALKFLIDCKHLDAPPEKPEKVGRPTKKRIQQGIDEALADDENLLEDYKRLGIDVSFLTQESGKGRNRRKG